MLAGKSQSRRVVAQSLSHSCGGGARCLDHGHRPGLVFGRWPSFLSLTRNTNIRSQSGVAIPPKRSADIRVFHSSSKQAAAQKGRVNDEDDDYGDWSSVAALESARKRLDWRQCLKTDAQLAFESDLSTDSTDAKLIDIHPSDFELWEQLLLYRLRVHGVEGIRVMWPYLLEASRAYKTRLWELPRLWKALEDVALQDEDVLHSLVGHIHTMMSMFEDSPDGFYELVVSHMLTKDDNSALEWHRILKKMWPERRTLKGMFNKIHRNEGALERFKTFCFELPAFHQLYDFAIPCLTKSNLIPEAVDWHAFFLEHGAIPPDFSSVDRLLRRLRNDGHYDVVVSIATGLADAGLHDGDRWLRYADKTSLRSFRDMLGLLNSANRSGKDAEPAESSADEPISDHFVARMFATTFLSLDAVFAGLQGLHCKKVGPLTLRELILRVAGDTVPTAAHTKEALQMLKKQNLEMDGSNYQLVVVSLAMQNRSELLENLLRSDEHPDTFQDLPLQEALLVNHIRSGNAVAVARTLEVLRVLRPRQYEEKWRVLNLCLEYAVKFGDREEISRRLDSIIEQRAIMDHGTFERAWNALLAPRRFLHKPSTAEYKQLDQLIGYLVTLTRLGHVTRPRMWIEVIQRLGWGHRFGQLEKLCVWLVNWCVNVNFRRTTRLAGQRISNMAIQAEWHERLLLKVFNVNTMQGLVAWGAKRGRQQLGNDADSPDGSEGDVELEVAMKRRLPRNLSEIHQLWGVRVLRKLSDIGLAFNISQSDVRRACTLHLLRLFGGSSKEIWVRRLRSRRMANMVSYAAAMEKIWGQKLFYPAERYNHRLASSNLQGNDSGRLDKFCDELLMKSAGKARKAARRLARRRELGRRKLGREENRDHTDPAPAVLAFEKSGDCSLEGPANGHGGEGERSRERPAWRLG